MTGTELQRWQKRVLSGLVLGTVVITVIFKGGVVFSLFLAAAAAVCFYEWIKLANRSRYKYLLIIFGAAYISAAFWYCHLIRTVDGNDPAMALIFMALLWASDTGAYMFGKTFGGPKMAPVISPNKTWAGFAGALIFPGMVTALYFSFTKVVLSYFTNDVVVDAWSSESFFLSFTFIVTGAIIGFVGQVGDLMISMLKRHVHVKDAGAWIPGHGGLLDRVDSMLLAAPVFFYIMKQVEDVICCVG